jgi:hypothetical protein
VGLHPFHIENQAAWRQVLADPEVLRQRSGCGETTAAMIALGDPFTTPIAQWLTAVDKACPGLPIVGGMASSAQRPGENVLLKNDRVYRQGLVGLALSGPIAVETVVSQGCRPIGRPMVITKSHDNVIEQIGGRPPLEVLRDTVEELSDAERELLQNGLMVGQAISEFKERFGRGDFSCEIWSAWMRNRARWRWRILCARGRPCSITSAMPRPPTRIWRCYWNRRRWPSRRSAGCSAVATGAARACLPRAATISRRRIERCQKRRWRGSSPRANSGRWGERIFCTGTRRAWRCFDP